MSIWYFAHGHRYDNSCFFPTVELFDRPARWLKHTPTLFGVRIGYDGVDIK